MKFVIFANQMNLVFFVVSKIFVSGTPNFLAPNPLHVEDTPPTGRYPDPTFVLCSFLLPGLCFPASPGIIPPSWLILLGFARSGKWDWPGLETCQGISGDRETSALTRERRQNLEGSIISFNRRCCCCCCFSSLLTLSTSAAT